MTWERMTIDEYAAFEQAIGNKVVKVNGIWWRETKPFFFRPLNIFEEISPQKDNYPKRHIWGGVQHRVPQGGFANSTLYYFLFYGLSGYSLQTIQSKKRSEIKKGIKNFTVKIITDESEFYHEGYKVYANFYNRSRYGYMKERRKKDRFVQWAKVVLKFPKINLFGAYQGKELVAISITFLLDETIWYPTFFAKTEALKLKVSDVLLHHIREKARLCQEARNLFWGMHSGNPGIDQHKLLRGCEIVPFPAYYYINPLFLFYLKIFRKKEFKRLLGNIEGG